MRRVLLFVVLWLLGLPLGLLLLLWIFGVGA
jgi:hypothetical protein